MANLWTALMAWRKKKTTGETDKTRKGLEQAGFSSKEMPTDYERTQQKTKLTGVPAKAKPVADPNAADIGKAAKDIIEWDKKQKARRALLGMRK
jgi:uncharacterized protein YjiS (DUF1127 family)